MDEVRIPPAGDPFHAAAHDQDRGHPHACYEGVVFIGYVALGEDGEEVEKIEAILCRRCGPPRGAED